MLSAPVLQCNLFVYFSQSNTAGQAIVVLLLGFSLVAWTVMIGKFLELQRAGHSNAQLQERLEATTAWLRIDPELSNAPGPLARLTRAALTTYHQRKGSSHALEHVENALQREVARESLAYEQRMVFLSTLVSGAPFLGLLGTVWGVMDAFGAIAGEASASIGALAPGVSGALLTTVAGLLVAIPAVFGYNYLLSRVKGLITDLETFASLLADRVELEAQER